MRASAAMLVVATLACSGASSGSGGVGAGPVTIRLMASRPSAFADGTDSIQLVAAVSRQSKPVSGRPVTFIAAPGSAMTPTQAPTDANGEARAAVTASRPGIYQATVSADGSSATIDLRFVAVATAAIRFDPLPASVSVAEPFDVVVETVDARGNPAPSADPITLSMAPHFSGTVLSVTGTAPGTFKASFDREAIGVVLIATAGTLSARSAPIDVHARQQADWQLIGPEGALNPHLFASPLDPRTLLTWAPPDSTLLQDHDRLLISRDGAASWAPLPATGLPAPLQPDWLSVAWCPDGALYVTALEGVFRSQDEGTAFEKVGENIGLVFCDAGSGPFLLQTSPQTTMLRWNGTAFSAISTPPIGSISAAPDGALFADGPDGIVRSVDDGATWTALPHKQGRIVAVSSSIVLVTGMNSVDRSADGGMTWTSVLGGDITDIARAPGGRLTALSMDGHIRRSLDDGATWTEPVGDSLDQNWFSVVDTGAATWAATGLAIYSVEGDSFRLSTSGMGGLVTTLYVDPHGAFLYGASGIGLLRKGDGDSWDFVLRASIGLVTFDPSKRGAMFASTRAGVVRSADSGTTWSVLAGAPAAPFVAPDGRTWYAFSGGLRRSDDAGASWKTVWEWNIGKPVVSAMAFDGDRIMFASNPDSGKIFPGVFRSDDRGATFDRLGSFGATPELLSLGNGIVVPSNVSRTDDFGQTFTSLLPDHSTITTVAAAPSNPQVLVAADQFQGIRPPALYASRDGGATWTRCLGGLNRLRITALAFDPGDSNILYASTDHGIWRSTNACR